jgi:hypothetical protein
LNQENSWRQFDHKEGYVPVIFLCCGVVSNCLEAMMEAMGRRQAGVKMGRLKIGDGDTANL